MVFTFFGQQHALDCGCGIMNTGNVGQIRKKRFNLKIRENLNKIPIWLDLTQSFVQFASSDRPNRSITPGGIVAGHDLLHVPTKPRTVVPLLVASK
jgi:hypothetical protein